MLSVQQSTMVHQEPNQSYIPLKESSNDYNGGSTGDIALEQLELYVQ